MVFFSNRTGWILLPSCCHPHMVYIKKKHKSHSRMLPNEPKKTNQQGTGRSATHGSTGGGVAKAVQTECWSQKESAAWLNSNIVPWTIPQNLDGR
jgi:hypothetical protein